MSQIQNFEISVDEVTADYNFSNCACIHCGNPNYH